MASSGEKAKSKLYPGMIVLGGRDQHGESLSSVEGYIIYEGRWIELPEMNIARSSAASALVGNQIVVCGGVTNGDIVPMLTDTIETLNLAQTPLQWVRSNATLPVPLSGHKTVVYQGNLITIGGYDGNREGNSDQIYEVPLIPHTSRPLGSLPQPRAWHGAELVNDKIFIFGGENLGVPNNEIVVYDLLSNRSHPIDLLPYPVSRMATVLQERTVYILGGVDARAEELDEVITYDVHSGRVDFLPSMEERRGGCCAVLCPTVEGNALVALGSLRQLNKVERFDFGNNLWRNKSPTKTARELSTAVVSPVNLNQFEQQ